jgi:hypothetical protein
VKLNKEKTPEDTSDLAPEEILQEFTENSKKVIDTCITYINLA